MKKGMTHEEHLDLAKTLLLVDKLLDNARDIIGRSYGYSARESNATAALVKKLERLRSMLDTRYHKVTTDEQFLKQGHVYFGELDSQELKNVQRDAARYRWLTHISDTNPLMVCDVANNRLFYGWEANDAIDAAMGKK